MPRLHASEAAFLEELCPYECVFTTGNRSAQPCDDSKSCSSAADSPKNFASANTTKSLASFAAARNCANRAPSAKRRPKTSRSAEMVHLLRKCGKLSEPEG